jgi:hypothetical protein
LRDVVRAAAHAEALRAMRRARGFVSATMREAFLFNGRTTRFASAATTPRVEPILLATSVNSVDSCFVAIRLAPLSINSIRQRLMHTYPHLCGHNLLAFKPIAGAREIQWKIQTCVDNPPGRVSDST